MSVLRLGRTLVVSKRTRLEVEALKHRIDLDELHHLTGQASSPPLSAAFNANRALDAELARRGFDVPVLRQAHAAHHRALNQVVRALESRKIEIHQILARSGEIRHLQDGEYDAVFAVGGDGTVLEAAQMIRGHGTPLIGVNSDPLLSTGRLAACSLARVHEEMPLLANSPSAYSTSSSVLHNEPENSFLPILDALETCNFSWLYRQRVSVVLEPSTQGEEGKGEEAPALATPSSSPAVVPHLALNEVLFAESSPTIPSRHDTRVESTDLYGNHLWSNQGPRYTLNRKYRQRSCGVIVSTGSGSTAWLRSASALHELSVQRVLRAVGKEVDIEAASDIARRLDEACVYEPHDPRMSFYVRDLISPPPPVSQSMREALGPLSGFAKKIELTAKGYDMFICLDGLSTHPVDYGTTAKFEIKAENALRSVIFDSPERNFVL